MNFTNLINKIESLDKPIETLTEVKKNAVTPNETKIEHIRKLSGLNESIEQPVEECGGMMPPMSRPETPVTMNVSVNATGKDSIRDLLDILKGAELDGADQAVGGPAGIVLGLGGDREDEFEIDEAGEDGGFKDASTSPDEQYADTDAAYPMGNDLSSKGDNEVEKVNGGGNPYASLSEQLKQNLHTLYKEVKSR